MRRGDGLLWGAAAMMGVFTAPAFADYFVSVRDNTGVELGGLSLLDGDLARYDPVSQTGSIFLSESIFTSGSIDLNAAHVRASGSIVLSTLFNGSIGGVSFGDGDVVEFDPGSGRANVLLPESAWGDFTTSTDVNGVFVRDDGRMVLSHNNNSDTLGGLTFTDGDIVEYDPTTDTATLLVAESSLFDDSNGDVDALHELANGNFVLSFADDEVIGGVGFLDGDLVEYDPVRGIASLFASEAIFGSKGLANDINAFSMTAVPGPGASALLLTALARGGRGRRRRAGPSNRSSTPY